LEHLHFHDDHEMLIVVNFLFWLHEPSSLQATKCCCCWSNRKWLNNLSYNTWQVESRGTVMKKVFLRVLDSRSLQDLRELLGSWISLGLSGI